MNNKETEGLNILATLKMGAWILFLIFIASCLVVHEANIGNEIAISHGKESWWLYDAINFLVP